MMVTTTWKCILGRHLEIIFPFLTELTWIQISTEATFALRGIIQLLLESKMKQNHNYILLKTLIGRFILPKINDI